jgi:hypothetical protein
MIEMITTLFPTLETASGKAMELVDCREAMKKNERH